MARKNFKDIDIYAGIQQKDGQQWQKENGITASWRTPEQIDIQPVYTKEDLEGMEPWTSRQVFLPICVVRIR